MPVSAIVLTFNEEHNIAACLESIVGTVAEIFIVDSGSTDRTLEIVRRYSPNIAEHPFHSYSLQRNWAQAVLPLAHDWVLHIDADERMSDELIESMNTFFGSGEADEHSAAMFSRRALFLGRSIRHGGHYPTYHARLFRRRCGRCEDRLYDQHFLVDGPIARLHGDLIEVVALDLDSWSTKHVRWAGIEAREMGLSSTGQRQQIEPRFLGNPIERRRWLRRRLYGNSPPFLRAVTYFLYRYFVRLGFLDGWEGLIFHVLQGFWYRFYIDAKIWEARKQAGDTVLDGA